MTTRHRPTRVYRVLVWGGWYGSRNVGDSAILLGIKRLFAMVNSRVDNLYVAALSTDPDFTSTHGVTGVRALLKPDIFKPWRWFALAREFGRADLVLVSGGTPIFDFSHIVRSVYFLLPILMRKRFIFFSIGVKPITSRYGRAYIPAVLDRAAHVSVRDRGSLEILQGLGVSNAVLTADAAFFAEPGSSAHLDALLERYGLSSEDRLLVVAPRLMSDAQKALYLDREMKPELVRSATAELVCTIDVVKDDFDRVVLFAMHYHGIDSDIPLCKEIVERVDSSKVLLIEEELRPELAISLLARADVVLAMRLHAALLAASMATPVVAVAYEQKVTDLMARLDLPDYCVDLFSLTGEELIGRLKEAAANKAKVEDALSGRTQHLRTAVMEQAIEVLRFRDED